MYTSTVYMYFLYDQWGHEFDKASSCIVVKATKAITILEIPDRILRLSAETGGNISSNWHNNYFAMDLLSHLREQRLMKA